MKRIAIIYPFVLLSFVISFLTGCDSTERDWTNAKKNNSISDYQSFLTKHASSVYEVRAKIAIDSLKWISILRTHNVDSLESFLKKYSSSEFFKTSKGAMDSIYWNIAFYSKDTARLHDYCGRYPESSNVKKANNLIYEFLFPQIKLEKINSLRIHKDGKSNCYGQWMGVVKVPKEGLCYFGGGPVLMDIFRDFKGFEERAKKFCWRTGDAYVTIKGKDYVVKTVDLSKSDAEICKEFGVYYGVLSR